MKKDQTRYPSTEGLESARKTIRYIEKTKKVRIELVEDRYTGTLYEMEVEDEDDICPVIKEARK